MSAGYVMCWSAKWYGEPEIMFDSVYKSKTKRMLRGIHELISRADAVIHYNGTKFDMPTLNKEFLLNGMHPPPPYKQIDLLRTSRGQFRFPSNKLEYIAKTLGLGSKTKHAGHQLWIDCMAKIPEAWAVMEEYNKNDVALLEVVYDKLKPWIKGHPNQGVYEGELCCPKCASHSYKRSGWAYTNAYKYQRFVCRDCGTWFRGSNNVEFDEPKRMTTI